MDAQYLAFPNNSFDYVLSTLALCTIHDPDLALSEILRVLKPKGHFLVIEHIQSKKRIIASILNWLTPLWKSCAHGCNLNRKTDVSIIETGFIPEYVRYLVGGVLIFGVYIKGSSK